MMAVPVPQPRLPAFALALALAACSPSYERTGQEIVLERPGLQVAVVQTYQSLPLHYYGLRHVLACRSPATGHARAVASEGLDAGWLRIGDLHSVPGQSPSRETRTRGLADAVAESRQAPEQTRRRPKPDFCTPQMDCRHLEFDDDGRSRFEDIRAERNADGTGWRIEATLHSPGLLDGLPRRIVTTDGGRTWQFGRPST
jgi:hypothetical protein